jgi:hypothetical protein
MWFCIPDGFTRSTAKIVAAGDLRRPPARRDVLWSGVRSRIAASLLLVVLQVACYGVPGVLCADGRVCPGGTTCDLPSDRCVTGEQIVACRDKADGEVCSVDERTAGVCDGGICRYPRCGDRVRNGGETCDGDDLGAAQCTTFGFYGGDLVCNASCTGFDVARCDGECGDGERNGPERCDRDDFGGASCQSFGWHQGYVACDASCSVIDATACRDYCGDGLVNGGELCDGAVHRGESCVEIGAVGGAIGCDTSCSPSPDSCQWGTWRRGALPDGVIAYALWGTAADDVWAAGDGGVARFDGEGWVLQDLGDPLPLRDIGGTGPNDVWAVSDGLAYHHDGATWTEETIVANRPQLHAVWSAGRDDVWAVGNGAVHRDATGWRAVPTPVTNVASRLLVDVWGSGPDDVWAVGWLGTVLHYDGTAWQLVDVGTTASLNSVRGTAADDVWIVGSRIVLHWDGVRWSRVAGAPERGLGNVWPTPEGDTWVTSSDGTLYRGDSAGWHDDGLVTLEALVDLWRSPEGELWALDSAGAIFRKQGRGWVIRHVDVQSSDRFRTVAVGTRGVPWALSSQGAVSRFAGGAWQEVAPVATPRANAIWADGADLAYVVGDGGVIRRYQDGAWAAEPSGTTARLTGVWGSGPDDVWAVGNGSTVLRRSAAGWQPVTIPRTADLRAVGGTRRDQVWIVTGDSVLVFDGAAWHEAAIERSFGSPVSVWASGPNDVWLLTGSFALLRYDGQAWRPVRVDPDIAVVPLISLWGSGPNDIWAVGTQGYAYHWDGASWSRSIVGFRSNLVAVGGSSRHDVWIVADFGTLIRRTDGLPIPHGGACAAPAPIGCGSAVVGAITQAPPATPPPACAAAGGGTAYYRLESPLDGRLSVAVEARGGRVALGVMPAGDRGGCEADGACRAETGTATTAATVGLDVARGDVLYLVLSAPPGEAPSFTLDVTCAKL